MPLLARQLARLRQTQEQILDQLTMAVESTPSPGQGSKELERITVVIGYFDVVVSRGLVQILSEDKSVQIIDTGLNLAALEHAVAQQAPQIAILDDGVSTELSVLERLRALQPTIGIIILTHQSADPDGVRLLARGMSGVSRSASAADIIAVVHATAEGRHLYVSGGQVVERSYGLKMASLTPREIEVVGYFSRGRSHAEIARELQLGVETIRTHSANIRRKLGVRHTRELIGLPISSDMTRKASRK